MKGDDPMPGEIDEPPELDEWAAVEEPRAPLPPSLPICGMCLRGGPGAALKREALAAGLVLVWTACNVLLIVRLDKAEAAWLTGLGGVAGCVAPFLPRLLRAWLRKRGE